MSRKLLFLLDGMALAYRAHFAFVNSNLKRGDGTPTGPVLGFANTIEKMLEEHAPSHVAVAWDTHAPTFRHIKDETYKANRPPQPEELRIGIPYIKQMLERWGITNIEKDGFEADDIIGTIASDANADDVDVYLVTPDKDFMQLVHDHIKMLKPNNKTGGFDVIDREGVLEYFGVYPEQVIDVLAIIGDTSDNIPGVPGIGKKGAPALINRFGSLDQAIKEADSITAKRQREGLQTFADQAMHAKFMVTIDTEVPDVLNWEQLEWKFNDSKELGIFFKEMEFRTLTRKYLGEQPPEAGKGDQVDLFGSIKEEAEHKVFKADEVEYLLANSISEVEEMVKELNGSPVLCFDTETDASDPITAGLVGFSFSNTAGRAFYVPVNIEGALPEEQVIDRIKTLFQHKEGIYVAHNYKFDYLMLKRAGIEILGKPFDTMIAAYLVDASQKTKMDELAKSYLKYEPIPIESLIGKGKHQKSMADLPIEAVYEYACEDADITLQLYHELSPLLENDELNEVANTVDFPLMEVLGDIEQNGICLDVDMLVDFSNMLEEDLKKLEAEIYDTAGETFNIKSTQQLGSILFEKLKLPSGKKTKTGQYSTNEAVLTDLAVKYELPRLVLEYRQIAKLKSTYVDALPDLILPETGRVHTDFNQSVAATGRLSSSNPNLQNIPIRTQRGREIRKAFIAEEGYQIFSADYSQVELRVIASISNDEAMMAAFKNEEDIHSRTAKEVFGLASLDEVTSDHRRKAKEVNFGIPYGVSAYGLATRLGIENSEGKTLIDNYFNRFPGILSYIEETKTFAKEHGYVKTLLGRRRYIPDIHSGAWNKRGFAERVAINMPIQGTAADIIKLAMINIHNRIEEEGWKSRMLLQVHDELVFEIHDSETDVVPDLIIRLMEDAYTLNVPLKVDAGLGKHWLEAH